MVGHNTHAAARSQTDRDWPISTEDDDSMSPPPPYLELVPLIGLPQPDTRSPVDRLRSTSRFSKINLSCRTLRTASWTNTRSFVAFVTFLIAVGLWMSTMPVTYCNGPADPQVRERAREEWSKEFSEHQKHVAEREAVNAQWAREDERRAILLHEREQESIQHRREVRERAQREERQRLGLFWDRVEAHQCKTYGTREYTAVLMNLPTKWGQRVDSMKACIATPLEVHGVAHLPKTCEDKGHGVVIGRWEIDQHEPDCNTFWNWYKDKGCTSSGSGKRRIEHYLENLPEGGNWREFCATTPARFHGLEFVGAQECFQWKWGTYGHWEIDDTKC